MEDKYFYYRGDDIPLEVSIPKVFDTSKSNMFLMDHLIYKDLSDREYNAAMGKSHGIFRNPLLSEILEVNKNNTKILEVV